MSFFEKKRELSLEDAINIYKGTNNEQLEKEREKILKPEGLKDVDNEGRKKLSDEELTRVKAIESILQERPDSLKY